jgi:hypothetical protein
MERFLKKASIAAGFEKARFDPSQIAPQIAPRFALIFTPGGEGNVSCELYDNGRGITVWKQSLPIASADRRPASQREVLSLALALRDGVFENGLVR